MLTDLFISMRQISLKTNKIWFLIIPTLFGVGGYFAYDEVNIYTMLAEKGPKHTLEYMMSRNTRYEDSYQKAWILYRNNENAEAKRLVKKLLKSDNMKIVADSYYLQGHIDFFERSYITSIQNFKSANAIYEKNSLYENMYYAQLGIATCLIDLGSIDESDKVLRKAIIWFEIATQRGVMSLDSDKMSRSEKIGLAQYYLVRKRYEFYRGNFDLALINAENCMILYDSVGSKNGKADIMIDVGFFHMLLGQYDDGWDYTFQARVLVNELNDSRKQAYLLLNDLLYRKCYEKKDYSLILKEINRRIVVLHDRHLNSQLQKVLNCECN